MLESARVVSDHPSYPKGGTFADFLHWHLEVWGTRSSGAPKLWSELEFRETIFGKGTGADGRVRLVNGWLGSGSPAGRANLKEIIKCLFGDDPIFQEWRIDLMMARERSQGKNGTNNRRSNEQPSQLVVGRLLSVVDTDHINPDVRARAIFHDIRAKIDFLKYNVSPGRLEELGETQRSWLARFEPDVLAVAWGYEVRTVPRDSITALVDQRLTGRRPMKPRERAELAEHLALRTPNRDLTSAATLFAPEIAFEQFTQALVESGWATKSLVASGRMKSLYLMLEAFKPFGFRTGGIVVGDEATITSAQQGQTRGMGLPKSGESSPQQSIALGTEVGLIVERLAAPRGIVLLEIGPASEGGDHPVTSLIPSTLAPSCQVQPGQLLPTVPVHGVSRFIANEPVGRHVWLAILTLEPLLPVWPHESGEPHQISDLELEWFLSALDDQMRDPSSAAALEVRHHAFSIVA